MHAHLELVAVLAVNAEHAVPSVKLRNRDGIVFGEARAGTSWFCQCKARALFGNV